MAWNRQAGLILFHASLLAYHLRDANTDTLKQAKARLVLYLESWLGMGEEDVLPGSACGSGGDLPGSVSDCDVLDLVIQAIDMKMARDQRRSS